MKDFQKNVSPYVDKNASKSDGGTQVTYYMKRGSCACHRVSLLLRYQIWFLMTKEELVSFLSQEGVTEEQIVLACKMFDAKPQGFVPQRHLYIQLAEEEQQWVNEHHEACRNEVFLKTDLNPYYAATGDVRGALRQQILHAVTPDVNGIYDNLTRNAMTLGYLISFWVHAADEVDIIPEGMLCNTLNLMAFGVIAESMQREVQSMTEDELQSAMAYAVSLYSTRVINICVPQNEIKQQIVKVYPEFSGIHERFIEPSISTFAALDALDSKFQTLNQENEKLSRQLNRNREIAAAIRKLQTKADKDFQFRYKYQWIGVYEVMGEQHLLPDGEKSTFCRLCNSPDNREYFLPEDENQLPNPYIPGESWDKESTWHQLSSHGDTPKQRRVIEKTKKEFSNLLREQGII